MDKLKSFGNNERIPLPDAFPYTDGITYSFGTGTYVSCRNETDPGTTIFNSHGKELGSGKDRVALTIKGCIATSSGSTEASEWCVRRATKYAARGVQVFNTLKLWAALYAISKGIRITENCGIFPIFKYEIPSKDDKNYDTSWKKTREIVRYAIEMKVDRDKIIKAKELRIKSLAKEVETIVYEQTESDKKADKLTEKQRKIITGNYTIQNTDGEICNKQSGCVITTNNRPALHGIDTDGTPIEMRIQRNRAYMYTFEEDERRIHQTEVDHTDGNNSNNVPWNYRWASRDENELAKHNEMKERVVQDDADLLAIYKEPSDPKVWNEGGMTLHSNMWISRPNEPIFVKIAEDGKYPRIGVTIADSDGTMRKRYIYVHMAITFKFIERIEITDGALANIKSLANLESAEEAEKYFSTTYTSPTASFSEFADDLKRFSLCILHGDSKKSNYRVENLRIGTPSENGIDRQNNPKTTDRICVDLFEVSTDDVVSEEPLEFDSHSKAAAYLEVTQPTVSKFARFNRTCEAGKRRKITHKTTNVEYHVVERTTPLKDDARNARNARIAQRRAEYAAILRNRSVESCAAIPA